MFLLKLQSWKLSIMQKQVSVRSFLAFFPSVLFTLVIAFKGDAQGLILEAVKKNEDKMEYSRILHAIKANFNHKYEEYRKKWGGGIMGSKSQVIQVMLTKLNVLSIWAQPQPQLQSQSSSVLLDDRSDRSQTQSSPEAAYIDVIQHHPEYYDGTFDQEY
ncbi:60S ribosomal protein L7a-2-like protein [Tanacetum coccineum]